jgi:hypothetical protein
VAALNKLKALKAALDENVASLESLRASFAKELEQTDRISQTLESLNQSFLENWEHLWMDNLGNALAGAWNSSETFRTRATLLAEAYRSALWRIDQSLGVERERLAALREAMPVLASPEGTLTVSR